MLHSGPKLIRNGRVDKKNLRREMLSEEELKSQLCELEVEAYSE
jgi:uncharacterized membrane protein YcaP (DUF421 family)